MRESGLLGEADRKDTLDTMGIGTVRAERVAHEAAGEPWPWTGTDLFVQLDGALTALLERFEIRRRS